MSKVRDALKEEPSNSRVDFVMHADTRWQMSYRQERNEWFRAPRRLASSDGAARCSSAHTTSITGLASDDHRRNQLKSSCVCNCIGCKVKDLRTLES